MRLYHYLETRWALDDIRRRRLKLSTIEDMNDPYEGFSVCSDHEVTQAALEKTQWEFVNKYIALCFSLSPNNILMWSHYGEKHRGICLGFDVLDELTRPVEYIHDVQTAGNMIVERREDFSVEEGAKIVDLQCGAKYDGWCYEQEVRIHLRRNEKDGETGQYFREFSERLVLKEVIAGVRFPYSKKLIQDALSGYSGQEEVTILKGRRSTQTFAIVLDEKWS
jgi:hypothetical protein